MQYLTIASPEILYFACGAVFLALAWRSFAPVEGAKGALLPGAALGVCCALKLTFLAWIPAFAALLSVSPVHTGKSRFLIATLGISGIVLGFVLTTVPVVGNYDSLSRFLLRVALRADHHESGAVAPAGHGGYLAELGQFALGAKGSIAWSLVGFSILAAAVYRRQRRGDLVPRVVLGMTTFAVVGIACS